MATVSLQTVFDEARRAIETSAADKAIGIAQHILVHFPRMIEGYRLLGEAHLNASQPEPAAAAFEHVLQADPENVAAYYGLGLARQSLDQRSAAITAFERALEIQPNLADLRSQLMRLYAETPGSAGQFRLSRAGLGRLYARGGMFGQAIDEFRAVLDNEPDRDDVKSALAEALWRDGQEDEAMEFCRDVLERQPDLLKPTVLLGYLLFATGQPEGESLWRRAAEQDATMTLARSLFDILPPIRVEEPVLPEFDEAEWRAKEARRSAEQPVPAAAPAFASTSEDDFFADSWLSSAGTTPAASTSRVYESDLNALTAGSSVPSSSADDDDLLASLLGFGSSEPEPAPAPSANSEQVQPFGFDWDSEIGSGAQPLNESLPSSLDDVGMYDAETAQRPDDNVGGVQPFSFDDWGLDSDLPAARTPAPAEDEADLDFPDISAFSLEDDEPGGVKPFSFEAEETSGVQPFSLDEDLDDFGGVTPFSFDEEGRDATTGSAPAPAESGLGNVQLFSLDDWGLDDAAGSNVKPLSTNELTSSDNEIDELGAFKPFSLDELSLDTLEDETSGLSGPMLGSDDQEIDESAGFSWQEPSWRAQTTQSERSEVQEGDSIFAKLMRNRPAEQPAPPEPEPAQPAEASADDEMSFFSIDDEPLRLDEAGDQDRWLSGIDTTGAEQSPTSEAATPLQGLPAADAIQPGDLSAQPADQTDDEELDLGSVFSLEDLEADQGFSWETGATNQTDQPAAQESETFSLADLGLSDDELAALDLEAQAPASASSEQEADVLPFSLNDLGLSDDELAALNLQEDEASTAEPTPELPTLPEDMRSDLADTAQPATGDEPDLTPFSLADLGLNDEELSFFEEAQAGQAAAPEAEAPANMPSVNEEAEADLTPFSLADLGLNDEELSFFDEAQSGQDLDTASHQTSEDVDTLFADIDIPGTSDETAQPEMPAASVDEQAMQEAEAAPVAPATGDEPDLTPFSLADLGLNDEELSFFEEAQSGQAAAPDAEAPAAPPTSDEAEVDLTPFSLADLGLSDEELSFFDEAQTEQAAPEAETPAGETAQPEAQQPAEAEPFESPFALADQEAGDVFERADQAAAAEATSAASPVAETQNVFHTNAPTSDHALPMDLPEGAQPTASAAEEYHPAAAQAGASGAMASGAGSEELAAFHAMLQADPDNDAMRLAVARMSQQTSDPSQALEHYKQLIKRGSLLDEVVVDLQDSIADSDDPQMLRRLHRLLGDAYMKQNRFREAMDEYSWTLARSR